WARLVRHQGDQACRLYRDLSWPPHSGRGSRATRTARRKIYVRTQQPMDGRRLPAMERGTLYEPFLLAECRAGGAQGKDRVCGVTFNFTRGRNNLQLRQGILRLLPQERRLPLRGVPHQGRRATGQKDDGAQVEMSVRDFVPHWAIAILFGAFW